LAIGLFPSNAAAISAGTLTCPQGGLNNTYTVTPAIDCVYHDGDTGGAQNLGDGQDGFLTNHGLTQNNAPFDGPTTDGPQFSRTWSIVCDSGNPGSCPGLNITNLTGNTANFQVTNSAFGLYALGVKDGSTPFWAVFLLDPNQLSGTVSMTGGSFSHFVLYGHGTPGCGDCSPGTQGFNPVPEPASLVLLSSGLAFAARKLRKRRADAAATV